MKGPAREDHWGWASEPLASSAIAELNARSITSLVVCEGDKPVGLVHLHDLLRIGVA